MCEETVLFHLLAHALEYLQFNLLRPIKKAIVTIINYYYS